MKLEISEIIHNVGQQATVPIDTPCPAEAELQCSEPVRGSLTLTNTGQHLLVRGQLATTVVVECSRCLKEVKVPVSAPIEEEFPLPRIDARGGVHWEEEDAAAILEEYQLNVDELARQHLSLAVPTAPVCDAACKGICPGCGVNLDEGECVCPPPQVDPRLAGLRALLDEQDEK